jgi:hypothetical protein
LDHGIATHPHVRIEGNLLLDNPFYEAPEQAITRRGDRNALVAKFDWLKTMLSTFLAPSPVTNDQSQVTH